MVEMTGDLTEDQSTVKSREGWAGGKSDAGGRRTEEAPRPARQVRRGNEQPRRVLDPRSCSGGAGRQRKEKLCVFSLLILTIKTILLLLSRG